MNPVISNRICIVITIFRLILQQAGTRSFGAKPVEKNVKISLICQDDSVNDF